MVSSLLNPSLRSSTQLGQLGVDIGTHAVKVARVERVESSWLLRSAHCELVQPGELPNEAAERAIVATVGTQARWLHEMVACSHSQHLVVRNGNLPLGNRHHVVTSTAALSPAEKAASAAQVLAWRSSWLKASASDSSEEAQKTPVHYIPVSPETARRSAASFAKVSADCNQVGSPPFCLARAALLAAPPKHAKKENRLAIKEGNGDPARPVVGMIDWSPENPLFVLTKQGLPFYARQFRGCGFDNVLKVASDRLGIAPVDIAQILRRLSTESNDATEPTLPTSRQNLEQAFLKYVSGPYNELIQQTDRTLQFLAREHRSLCPRYLMLCGGGAIAPQIDQLIERHTGYPTTLWKLPTEEGQAARAPSTLFATAAALSAASIG